MTGESALETCQRATSTGKPALLVTAFKDRTNSRAALTGEGDRAADTSPSTVDPWNLYSTTHSRREICWLYLRRLPIRNGLALYLPADSTDPTTILGSATAQ